jgi:hypothetical protein
LLDAHRVAVGQLCLASCLFARLTATLPIIEGTFARHYMTNAESLYQGCITTCSAVASIHPRKRGVRDLPVLEKAAGAGRILGRFKNCKSNQFIAKLERTKVGFATVTLMQNDQELPEAQSGARYVPAV